MSAFFVSAVYFSPVAFSQNCNSHTLSPAEPGVVKWVYDGDTLLLNDKRKIRIIGIDTPEIRHHQQAAQAYGAKAREALRELLKEQDYQILLRFGKEKYDRYQRLLAHVFLPDGTNLSNWLLENGFARTLAIPPNIELANCYKLAEQRAQTNTLRIWRLKNHQLKSALSLPSRIKGYVRLKGSVKKVLHYKKSIIIELDSNPKRPIQIKVKKRNLRYFKNLDPDRLWGRKIEISGWLKNKHGKRRLYLNHPSQLTIIKEKKKLSPVPPVIEWSLQQ